MKKTLLILCIICILFGYAVKGKCESVSLVQPISNSNSIQSIPYSEVRYARTFAVTNRKEFSARTNDWLKLMSMNNLPGYFNVSRSLVYSCDSKGMNRQLFDEKLDLIYGESTNTINDVLYFFFNGHCFENGNIVLNDNEGYPINEFIQKLLSYKSGKIFILLDGCRSGHFVEAVRKLPEEERAKFYVITAVDSDDDSTFTWFSKEFLKGMDLDHSCQNIKMDYDNDNNVKFKEIRKYLRENYNWTIPKYYAADDNAVLFHFGDEKNHHQTLAVGFDDGVAAVMQDGSVKMESLLPSVTGTYKEVRSWKNVISIAYGHKYLIALLEDGTVRASVSSKGLGTDSGQCNIKDWKDIQQVATGLDHTVGLKSDGTVVAVGSNEYGQCDVSGWKDIVMIAAGDYHTVGLKSNGTVVAVGRDSGYYYDQCAVEDWTDIKQITAGSGFTAGLCTDGTVKTTHIDATGYYPYGKPEDWNNVTFLAAGGSSTHLLALRDDGSVVGIGPSDHGLGGEFINAGKWKDMALLACGRGISVGVKKDGTVLAVGIDGNQTLKSFQNIRIE